MAKRDEDDVPASPSSSLAFTRADGGKRDALQRKVEEQVGHSLSAEFGKLKSQTQLQNLKTQMKNDPNTKVDQKVPDTFGTQPLKQEEEQSIQTADTKPNPDALQQQAKNQKQEKKQGQERQGNVD